MDIVLEIVDTYLFDTLYAALLPVQSPTFNTNNGLNSTTFDAKSASPWQYQPASTYLSFPPGEAAYMSQWTRDNIYRQLITLYLITW